MFWRNCPPECTLWHHLLIPMYVFFLLWNTKEEILKNIGNQAVLSPNDLYFCPYNGNQWHLKPLGYQHSSKCVLCSMQGKQVWDNMRVSKLCFVFIFVKTVTLSYVCACSVHESVYMYSICTNICNSYTTGVRTRDTVCVFVCLCFQSGTGQKKEGRNIGKKSDEHFFVSPFVHTLLL